VTTGPPDTAATRVLTVAALVALGCALALSGLVWRVDLEPGVLVSVVRPPAGSLAAFLAALGSAVAMFVVRELTASAPVARLRPAMWTAFAAGVGAAFATVAAVLANDGVNLHLVGPAGLLVPIALGAGAALALLTSSSLYETLHRDRLAPDAVEAAHVRLEAVLRPPDIEYYI
jgi:hypothetical protein